MQSEKYDISLRMTQKKPFKYFKTSPQIIRLAVMYYIRYQLSYRDVEDILFERGIDISHETIKYWVERFGRMFAREISIKLKTKNSNHRWHIDKVFVKINGELFYMWRAVDHEVEVLDVYVSDKKDAVTAKKFILLPNSLSSLRSGRWRIQAMKNHGLPDEIVTDLNPS